MLIKINKNSTNSLVNAYLSGDIALFKQLIKDGHDVNCLTSDGFSLISTIIKNGYRINKNKDFFDAMMDADVHLGTIGREWSLLQSAVFSDDPVYMIGRLLDNGIDINFIEERVDERGSSAYKIFPVIFHILIMGDMNFIEKALKFEPELNVKRDNGDTILHFLMTRCECSKNTPAQIYNIMKILIEKGVDLNAKNSKGETFLHHMPRWVLSSKLLDLLIENNVDINLPDANNNSILLKYIKKPNISSIKLLIRKGADVNFNNGMNSINAIHVAADIGRHDILKILKDNNADFSKKNHMLENVAHIIAQKPNLTQEDKDFLKENVPLLFDKKINGSTPMDIIKNKHKNLHKEIIGLIKNDWNSKLAGKFKSNGRSL